MTAPHTDPKPLEPWALELLRQDQAGDDPHTQQELARLVALLRALPDPERSPDLARRILEHVAEHGSRSRVTHALFGGVHPLVRPGVAAMLAAGIAALFAFALSPESVPSVLRIEPGAGIGPSRTTIAGLDPASAMRRRSHVLIRPQFVSAVLQTPERSPFDEAFEASLDRQLNQLMIDPTAFAERLELVAQRDQFIARLARRAAERGDAPEIALRVRESPHPLASQLVESLLGATLVANASPR